MRDPSTLPQDIRTYLEAENSYCEAQMEDTSALQDVLFEEMKGRIKQDDSSVPAPDGEYAYSSRYEEGKEYPLFIRTPRAGAAETVLFDGPAEASEHEYFSLGMMKHSPDHSRLAWSVDTNGSEYHHMRIRDLESGADGADLIRDVGSFQWCADSRSFVYVEVDENHRPSAVYFKQPGQDSVLIYEEEVITMRRKEAI